MVTKYSIASWDLSLLKAQVVCGCWDLAQVLLVFLWKARDQLWLATSQSPKEPCARRQAHHARCNRVCVAPYRLISRLTKERKEKREREKVKVQPNHRNLLFHIVSISSSSLLVLSTSSPENTHKAKPSTIPLFFFFFWLPVA